MDRSSPNRSRPGWGRGLEFGTMAVLHHNLPLCPLRLLVTPLEHPRGGRAPTEQLWCLTDTQLALPMVAPAPEHWVLLGAAAQCHSADALYGTFAAAFDWCKSAGPAQRGYRVGLRVVLLSISKRLKQDRTKDVVFCWSIWLGIVNVDWPQFCGSGFFFLCPSWRLQGFSLGCSVCKTLLNEWSTMILLINPSRQKNYTSGMTPMDMTGPLNCL